ncbi:AAA family ATPase [Microvirga sp. KLBC 81]|uniref:AAA family ATPase n=1 Tax=Microvirga sp. KLBC 81 TaxID=1862707 RepID=UPI001403E41B|nr:AAA family ATPase [Microvirga sp. KLBC 81]
MQTFVIHTDPANERIETLTRLLQQLGHSSSITAGWPEASEGPGYSRSHKFITVPDTAGDASLAEKAVQYLTADQSGSFLVYIADTMAPDLYKRLVKSGRGEWISWQAVPQEFPDLVNKLSVSAGEGAVARVISFLPSAGGVGNTTLALETGFCLASEKKKDGLRVAVVDLNFQTSTLADLLDLEPSLDVSELIDRPERLDDRLIDVFTSRHSSRLDVFSSPTRFDHRELPYSGVVFSLLDGLSRRYDFVIIDLPHQWAPWVDSVLQGSDAVTIVGGSTVPAVKQLMKRVQHVDSLDIPLERTKVVVNQCDATLFGSVARKPDIDRVLVRSTPIYIRRDAATANQAANTGRPMLDLAPRRPVSKSIRQLATWMQTAMG